MVIDPSKPYDLTFTVTPTYADWRLDRFVKAMVPSMSRTKIQKYIKAGRVTLEKKPRAANWLVRLHDVVTLHCHEPADVAQAAATLPLDIVYEDEQLLAVNKQPGLVVHPAGRHRHGTLLNALYWRYKDILPEEAEISLANRLDQDTSGLVLVAKSTAAKRCLQEQFENRLTQKVYRALCLGAALPASGEIDAPLGPVTTHDSRQMKVREDELGKPSLTRYQVLASYPPQKGDPGFSWLALQPHTGRQHQLRVHLAHLGCPLVGDMLYGDGRTLAFPAAPAATVSRYALHALTLSFTHPAGGTMTLEAPLAADLKAAVAALDANKPRALLCQTPPQGGAVKL